MAGLREAHGQETRRGTVRLAGLGVRKDDAGMEKTDKVLLALYAEAIKGGTFAEVTRTSMGMEPGEFGWTLYLLQMMGKIEGCKFLPPHPDSPGNLMAVTRTGLMLTPKGFEAAEEIIPGRDSFAEKLCAVWELMRDVGCGVMANIIYGWLN